MSQYSVNQSFDYPLIRTWKWATPYGWFAAQKKKLGFVLRKKERKKKRKRPTKMKGKSSDLFLHSDPN